jgi:hypothetical protein
MTQLTRRGFIHAGTVAVGGMSFALPTFIPQMNAQAGAKVHSMYITVSQVRVTPGRASEIAHRVCSAIIVSLCCKRVGAQPTCTELGAKQHWTRDCRARIIVEHNNPYLGGTPWR